MRKCQQPWAGCLARRLPGQLATLWAAAGGLPLFAGASPGTEHLLVQQGWGWVSPGAARGTGAPSIDMQPPEEEEKEGGGGDTGGRPGGCWAHSRFGTGKMGLA